jgi:Bacterial regulatory proteins, luxR family
VQHASHGRIPRGYLGLGLRLVALEGGRSGAMVMNVDARGPGATAGIYQGDIVIDEAIWITRAHSTSSRGFAPSMQGASNKVIARRLGISVHTAKFHVASLLDKLDAVGRTDAVAHAARRGVINL